MATDVAVLVPWASSSPDRIAAWEFLRPRWPWPVIEGTADEAAWCKADAVADALTRTDAEVLVIADADVWCDGISAALHQVASGAAAWAVPHLNVFRLDADATAAVLRSGRFASKPGGLLAEQIYRGHAGGGITVVRRDVYEACALDRRFVGWGQEDDAWALALGCLYGKPWRGTVPLWHLWHEPMPRQNRRVGSTEGRALHQRYATASTEPAAMRALLAETAEVAA